MIYEFLSKNETPVSQMHIYLKNKTGNDGGNIPEIINDLAVAESINGLYAFAVYCVITDNLKKEPKIGKDYPTKEVMLLAFVQYLKGMATTVNLNKPRVSKLYENLENNNILGASPTILNLDGDLFETHYDKSKYYSKEVADKAEDSFPYWVLNVVKEIQTSNELITPKKVEFALPYYIQNISSEWVKIYDSPIKSTRKEIGKIPPTGTEPVISININQARLATSMSAWIDLDDKVIPVKHLVNFSELEIESNNLVYPELPFKINVKDKVTARKGINDHYDSDESHEYKKDDSINITSTYMTTFGVTEDGFYIPLSPDHIYFIDDSEHTNIPDIQTVEEETIEEPAMGINLKPFSDSKYLIVAKCSNENIAEKHYKNIVTKSEYKNGYAIKKDKSTYLIIAGADTLEHAIAIKKNTIKYGCKSTVVLTEEFL